MKYYTSHRLILILATTLLVLDLLPIVISNECGVITNAEKRDPSLRKRINDGVTKITSMIRSDKDAPFFTGYAQTAMYDINGKPPNDIYISAWCVTDILRNTSLGYQKKISVWNLQSAESFPVPDPVC
ncbi:hypothetical protein AXF42_Ash018575 [Apostasia shenzhenica]|uniref:Uncharacterized protein n=1 Tax=Apostasia shenzhenica TaxID=1088818 RepID=A0A2I0APX1_9ASPA|nr:hypothetical protein AXF42_Ash018575 [Apostasia shenzhenica]